MPCNFFSCEFPCCLGRMRYMIAFMCLSTAILCYCHRVALNIGVVEMVSLHVDTKPTCPKMQGNEISSNKNMSGGIVKWDHKTQNVNIAAFFIGYVIGNIPLGILCDKYGGRPFLALCIFISSATTAIIPVVAVYLPWWYVFLIRIVTGVAQSCLFPSASNLISHWIPATERTTVSALIFCANSLGLIIGNTVSGLLMRACANWTIPYYLWSGIGIFLGLLILIYVFSDPRTHPFLSKYEQEYLIDIIPVKDKFPAPWRAILSDKCVYGLLFAQTGNNLIVFTLANNLPKYLNDVLGLSMTYTALVCCVFILSWIASVMAGRLADYLWKKNVNNTLLRKSYTVTANTLASGFLILAGLSKCNYVFAILCFGSAIFSSGIYYAGMTVNIIDISRNHSGLMMSIVNGIASVSGFFASYMIGVIASENTHEQWLWVFLMVFGIQLVGTSLYLSLSTTKRRKWDYAPDEPIPEPKKVPWYLEMTPSDHIKRLEGLRREKDST